MKRAARAADGAALLGGAQGIAQPAPPAGLGVAQSLRSPEPQQPPKDIPPTDVDTIVVIPLRRAQRLRHLKPGRRCGPGDPLCAAEERSAIGCARSALQHLTR
ncbi:MAG: hypothetical protein EOO27_32395, partial [Comamonadaceae bacterium]